MRNQRVKAARSASCFRLVSDFNALSRAGVGTCKCQYLAKQRRQEAGRLTLCQNILVPPRRPHKSQSRRQDGEEVVYYVRTHGETWEFGRRRFPPEGKEWASVPRLVVGNSVDRGEVGQVLSWLLFILNEARDSGPGVNTYIFFLDAEMNSFPATAFVSKNASTWRTNDLRKRAVFHLLYPDGIKDENLLDLPRFRKKSAGMGALNQHIWET
ncbi:hypothetical protein DFS34DRAFT_285586 [Phlyctochytrium arcticum]|nr:hypothetical protein DFS34DRAFT_285586 [Phlyctochytrium arcticum]